MIVQRSRKQRGNFAVLFAFLITALMGFAALAIDVSYIRTSRMQLTNAVDAAAHAALLDYRRSSNEASATAVDQSVAAQNKVGGRSVTVDPADVVYGQWDFDARAFTSGGAFVNAVQVTATRDVNSPEGPINLFFAPVLGIQTATADASAVGAFRFREMMMVLDVTGSFQQNMDNARDAVVGFLDYVYANQFPQDKIGLTIFANVAQEYDELQNVADNYSALRGHWLGNGVRTCTSCTSIRASSDWNPDVTGLQVCHKCDQAGCNPTGSYNSSSNVCHPPFNKCTDNVSCAEGAVAPSKEGTAPAEGLQAGLDALIDAGLNGNVKVVVFIGDGKPQCRVGNPPESMSESCPALLASQAIDQADRATENNITIYTVSFCDGCDPGREAEQYAFMQRLVTGSGRAYSTTEGDDLSGILEDIARSLPVALVE
jgi:Flp pilus assembly protein TadG